MVRRTSSALFGAGSPPDRLSMDRCVRRASPLGRETMQVMDTAELEELRLLRARAYGPSADIDQDREAVARLDALEALSRGPAAAPSGGIETADATAEPEPEPESKPEPEPPEDAGPSELPDGDPAEAGPSATDTAIGRRPSRGGGPRYARVLWPLSVVASAALAAGVTYAVTAVTPVSVSSGAPQIATLEPSGTVEVPVGWFGAGPSSAAYEFFGLTLFETTSGFQGPGGECFTVVGTDQLPAEDVDSGNWSMDGSVYSGCRVGDFPATVEVPIDSNAPEELRARFSAARALQFVLDGDRVGVFLDGG